MDRLRALGAERKSLEGDETEQAQEFDRRKSQLRAAALFTHQIAATRDMPTILSQTVDSLARLLGHQEVNLFLIEEQRNSAVLRSSSSESGQKRLEEGSGIDVNGQSLEARTIRSGNYQLSTSIAGGDGSPEPPVILSQAALPLLVRGEVIGVLSIRSERETTFNRDEIEVLQILADQVAASIGGVRLLSQSESTAAQLENLTSRQTRQSWQQHLENRNAGYQFTPGGVRPLPPGKESAEEDSLRVPLMLRGQEIGSIALQRKDAPTWEESERDLIEKVAAQVALALDNSRLLEETRQRAAQEQTVNEISARISRSMDVDTLLQTAVRELAALPDVGEALVFIEPIGRERRQAPNKTVGGYNDETIA